MSWISLSSGHDCHTCFRSKCFTIPECAPQGKWYWVGNAGAGIPDLPLMTSHQAGVSAGAGTSFSMDQPGQCSRSGPGFTSDYGCGSTFKQVCTMTSTTGASIGR